MDIKIKSMEKDAFDYNPDGFWGVLEADGRSLIFETYKNEVIELDFAPNLPVYNNDGMTKDEALELRERFDEIKEAILAAVAERECPRQTALER